MAISPTQRTLKYLKDLNLNPWIVERFIKMPAMPGNGRRVDLYNCIDLIAIEEGKRVIGVQSTGQDFRGHYLKITTETPSEAKLWLSVPCTELWLIGWRKLKVKRGGKAMRWEPRIHKFTKEDFSPSSPSP